MKYVPLNNYVIVKIQKKEETTSEGGVILPSDTSQKLLQKAQVVAASMQAMTNESIYEKDIVLVHRGQGRFITEDEDLMVFDADHIISKVTE